MIVIGNNPAEISCTIEFIFFKEKIPDLSLSFPIKKPTLALFTGNFRTQEGKMRSIQLKK